MYEPFLFYFLLNLRVVSPLILTLSILQTMGDTTATLNGTSPSSPLSLSLQ